MHDGLYNSMLRDQLDRARRGFLTADWRDQLAKSCFDSSSDGDPYRRPEASDGSLVGTCGLQWPAGDENSERRRRT
ncbi:hypothetical protein I553_10835 [Mycobacterium xenopi 4042]|uniref:Uncharacterized protein n=1 Tax=Mycobacterium xenopi 4042 TaxID=1299334 RepID=X8DCR4_MYCXE|nr:hypothetical protein I553_10637 [Mycobacterium xenopi 4042]EUA65538.1 hypothetical protein I553_10835 [Mycobacterium xenopi 4042]